MKLFSFFTNRKKLTRILCICLICALFLTSGLFYYFYETSEIIEEDIKIKETKPSGGTVEIVPETVTSEEYFYEYVENDNSNADSSTENTSRVEDTNEESLNTDGSNDDSDEDQTDDFQIEMSDDVEDYSVKTSFVPKGYKKVWGDDFEGSSIDKNKWGILPSSDKDTLWSDDSDVLDVENGLLKLTTKHFFDPFDSLPKYKLPAEINTMKTMNFQYGYLEMCARVPYKNGAWPSLWLKGINGVGSGDRQELVQTDYKNDDYSSEIDIFENFGTSDTISPNLHKWYTGVGNANVSDLFKNSEQVNEYRFSYLSNLNNEYHVYGFEWTKEKITVFVDGEAYHSFDITEKGNFDDAEHQTDMSGFHDPHYLIIWNNIYTPLRQTYNFVNPSDLPLHYDIDWIHLYQKPDLGKIYTKGTDKK